MDLHIVIDRTQPLGEQLLRQLRGLIRSGRLATGAQLPPTRLLAEQLGLARQTVAEAYERLYYVERVAQVQLFAMWTGQPLKKLSETVVEKTRRDYGGDRYDPSPTQRHFDALKRILDRKEPDYAT